MFTEQLSLFPQEKTATVHVTIRREIRNGKYLFTAEICGGWWIGHGKTKEAAIKQAVRQFKKERRY